MTRLRYELELMSHENDSCTGKHIGSVGIVLLVLVGASLFWMLDGSRPAPVPSAANAIHLMRSANYQYAIREFDMLLKVCPDSVRWLRLRGFAYDKLGMYEAGIEYFTAALHYQPQDVATLNNRGYAFYQIGQVKQAVADYNRAIELNATFVPAHGNRALALVARQQYAEALQDIGFVLAHGDTVNSTLFNLQGYCLTQRNLPNEAIEAFNRAIMLDSGYTDALQNRAAAYRLKTEAQVR